jgi:glycosyltransferase involved in cell wall biosynthesis
MVREIEKNREMYPKRENKESDNKDGRKVSVIIPTYNRSSYLKRAIQSVLNQNHDNIEVIVVDDTSTDNTEEVVQSFHDDRIIYIKNEKNKGANFSRNVGLKKATGTYISFLDDDDYFSDTDKLKEQIRLLDENKNVVFVACGYYDKSIDKKRFPTVKGKVDKELLLSFSNIETSTIMIRKDIIEKIGYLDECLPSEQNHDFFYRISKMGEFDYLDRVMVIKDKPPTQISCNPKNKFMGYVLFHKKYFNDIRHLDIKKFLYVSVKFFIVCFIFLSAIVLKRNLDIVKIIDEKLKSK